MDLSILNQIIIRFCDGQEILTMAEQNNIAPCLLARIILDQHIFGNLFSLAQQ
jgi:hypothetical protein